jgi:hypothetical protein
VLIPLVWVFAARVKLPDVEDSLITKSSRPELDSLSHGQIGSCWALKDNLFHFFKHLTTCFISSLLQL